MARVTTRKFTPKVFREIERVFRAGSHAVIEGNTEDRLVFGSPSRLQILDVPYALAAYLEEQKYRIAIYTPSQGIKELCPSLGSSKPIPNANGITNQAGIMNAIMRLQHEVKGKWVVIVLHPEMLAPRGQNGGASQGHHMEEFFHCAGKDPAILNGPSRLLLICYNGLPSELITNCPGYEVVEMPLPDEQERELFITKFNSVARMITGKPIMFPKRTTPGHVAKWTGGMTLIGMEKMLINAAHDDAVVNPGMISQAKTKDIERLSQGTLEVFDPEYGFEKIGGLRSLKLFFQGLVEKFHRNDRDVPMSILFAGVPGAGKTLIAMAVANALGRSLVKLGEIHNSYLGESERRLNLALRIVEQIGQTVLFVDEFDRKFGHDNHGPSGDSGTGHRIEASWMEWSSKPSLRGDVLIIAATNHPERLKPAVLDRFDYVAPFTRPSKGDMAEIAYMIHDEIGRKFGEIKDESIGEVLEGINLTGRNLRTILVSAGQIADQEAGKPNQPIRLKHVKMAAQNFIPRVNDLEMEIMELNSLNACNFRPLLPGNGPQGRLPDYEIPHHLQMYLNQDGGLDKIELEKNINQLKESNYVGRIMS